MNLYAATPTARSLAHRWYEIESEGLPEDGARVLVCGDDDGTVFIAELIGGCWRDDHGDAIEHEGITHWHPLPLAPLRTSR